MQESSGSDDVDAGRTPFTLPESVAQEPKRKRPKTTPSATRNKRAADTPATWHAAHGTRLSENLATMTEIAARIRVHRHAESGLQSGLHPGCGKLASAAVAARAGSIARTTTNEKEYNTMSILKLFPSKYLKHDDIVDGRLSPLPK